MTEIPITQLGIEFGGGGALGVLAGWAMKKLIKLVAVLAGAVVVMLSALESEGLIIVRWGALREYAVTTSVGAELSDFMLDVIGTLPVGSGFAVGALLGFKKG
jgi:uncharacterized membrane protein (Fun14 family)